MTDLRDRAAVITGGATGIGRALAERFAAEGMRLVLGDIDEKALEDTAAALRSEGTEVHTSQLDVSDGDDVERLGREVADAVGPPHVVCLNAGVGPTGPVLEMSRADWEWLVGVNLMGVAHGIRVLVPPMVEAGDGHVVATASGAGLMAVPTLGPYTATKHAVVGLSETLYLELRGTGVGVSVVCPGLVRTGIFDSERNRPERFGGQSDVEGDQVREFHRQMLDGMGIEPSEVADRVLDAVREDRFWVLPHDDGTVSGARAGGGIKRAVERRARSIIEETNPAGLEGL